MQERQSTGTGGGQMRYVLVGITSVVGTGVTGKGKLEQKILSAESLIYTAEGTLGHWGLSSFLENKRLCVSLKTKGCVFVEFFSRLFAGKGNVSLKNGITRIDRNT